MLCAATYPTQAVEEDLLGRHQLLQFLQDLLRPSSRIRVVVLFGDAGSGKSALAAAVAERWRRDGGSVEAVERGAQRPCSVIGARRLLVLDPADAPAPASSASWRSLMAGMRPEDRLLVVTREPVAVPVDDARLFEVRVPWLSWDDAVELLAREGVAPDERPGLVRWAEGSPLLLVLGGQAQHQHPDWEPGAGPEPATLTERLVRRLGRATEPAPRDRVRELVAVQPLRLVAGSVAVDAAPGHAPADRTAAEQAVRDYQSFERLSDNPLGVGATRQERVEHLRARIDEAVARAFGGSHADAALLEVLEAGYLVAAAPHERLALDLHLSRSTYFRRLASAVRRVADQLVEDEPEGAFTR